MWHLTPPATRALITTNGLVFLLQLVFGDVLLIWFALWPLGGAAPVPGPTTTGFLPWQLVTYSFLHGSLMHLLFNLFGLFIFGSDVERLFGRQRFLTYYFVSVVTAGIAQLVMSAVSGAPPYPTIGASGGLFGVLLAFGLYFPRRTILLIFPPIPMPARVFVFVYAAIELYLGVTGTQQGVAHFAHLGGMLGGFLLIRYWRHRPHRRS
jgi:membrane associated rhomboid family serine protease